jgi:hypothetical protein
MRGGQNAKNKIKQTNKNKERKQEAIFNKRREGAIKDVGD